SPLTAHWRTMSESPHRTGVTTKVSLEPAGDTKLHWTLGCSRDSQARQRWLARSAGQRSGGDRSRYAGDATRKRRGRINTRLIIDESFSSPYLTAISTASRGRSCIRSPTLSVTARRGWALI